MSKDVYNPGNTYWAEVRRLDILLYERGERRMRGLLGKIAAVHTISWANDDKGYTLVNGRLMWAWGKDRWLSSHLCEYEEAPAHGDLEGDIGREVIYDSIARGGYVFGDFQHFLPEDGDDREMELEARQLMRYQQQVGLSKPSEETYLFILDALRTAEQVT